MSYLVFRLLRVFFVILRFGIALQSTGERVGHNGVALLGHNLGVLLGHNAGVLLGHNSGPLLGHNLTALLGHNCGRRLGKGILIIFFTFRTITLHQNFLSV